MNAGKRGAPRPFRALLMAVVLSVAVAGCQDDDPAQNGANQDQDNQQNANQENHNQVVDDFDYGDHDPYDLVPFQDGVDSANGHADVDGGVPGAGQVQVGRISGDDTGFEGVYAHCRSGDFLMRNEVIEVCIQSESTNRYEHYTGGKLVDARRHDSPAGDDVLDMVFPLIDFGTTTAANVEVVRDGSDGVAVLRVTGTDIELAHLTGVLSYRVGNPLGITVETEYRLEPGSDAVEMVTQWTPRADREYTMQVGDWLAYGDRSRAWTPGEGFGIGDEMPWIGAAGEQRSFGLVFEDEGAPMGIADNFDLPWAEMRIANLEMSDVEPGVMRRWFMVGDGTVDSLRVQAARLRGESIVDTATTVELDDEGGEALAGAELLIDDGEEVITVGHTDAEGEVDLLLDAGTYTATISDVAGPLTWTREFTVDEPGDEISLTLPETVGLSVSIDEAQQGTPLSTRLSFSHPEHGTWFEYAGLGSHETKVPAGDVTVTATRGMEYDLYQEVHQWEAGQDYELAIELVRSLDTAGWIGADFHQHMEPSVDSQVHLEDRVWENATQGVELVVPTDHEVITDLQPIIDRLGLSDTMSTFPGVEISPTYSHYNLYPVPYRPDLRGRGSIELAYMDDQGEVQMRRMPEIIEAARAFETDPIVQMNHPRNGSGMMAHVNFDPELGPDAVTDEDFADDIDAMEIINRYDDVCQVAADWSGMLNAGRRVTGLGNSDSHRTNAEAGAPRNYLHMDVAPGDIDPADTRETLRAGRVSVASHAFVDLGDEMLPGDTLSVDDQGRVQFEVRVQTPDWARAQTLLVIVNGEIVERIDGDSVLEDNIDFEEVIDLEFEEDSWVVFWTDGPQPSTSLPIRRQVIGFTNPVFVRTTDADWQAPGPRPLDLGDLDAGYCG